MSKTIILKLVGSLTKDYNIQTNDEYFTKEYIIQNLNEKGVQLEYFANIKFILKGEYLINLQKYNFDTSNKVLLYVFVHNDIIRKDLIKNCFEEIEQKLPAYSLFPKDETSESSESEESEDELSSEEIDKINSHIIKEFEDPDLLTLIRISLNKPHLLGTVNSYITNGSIIEKIELKDTSEFKYDNVYKQIEDLGFINDKPDIIKSIIIHFNGHLNMIIRYILNMNLNMASKN